jgi:Transposase DDE domain
MGDKGYDADAILADLEDRGIAAVTPPKRNRKVQPIIDGHLYALRNLVERCFPKPKHSRRLATRHDKTADSYIGFVLVAAIRLWVRTSSTEPSLQSQQERSAKCTVPRSAAADPQTYFMMSRRDLLESLAPDEPKPTPTTGSRPR